jgi:hypothetical protein
MVSDKSLKRLYNRLNAAYFGNELPDVTLWWEPCNDAIAITYEITDPEGNERELGIKFDPQVAAMWSIVKQRMLHECCHVKLWECRNSVRHHGKLFWQEMDRLWQIGAFWKESCL